MSSVYDPRFVMAMEDPYALRCARCALVSCTGLLCLLCLLCPHTVHTCPRSSDPLILFPPPHRDQTSFHQRTADLLDHFTF